MVFIAALALVLSINYGGIQSSLPLLGVLALSAQRLLPALQQAYNAWTAIKGHQSSLNEVITLLDLPVESNPLAENDIVEFSNSIELVNVCFSYDEGSNLTLNNVSLRINSGERIGIIGSTGSGKSTLVDILMGLLAPTSGKMLIDQLEMRQSTLVNWRKKIAHVPQNIFLTDGSIRENISFGVSEGEIDDSRIKLAAECASLSLVIDRMPNGYNSLIGERGVFLSGGERQRLGIARALYKDSTLIVLDEATSALDSETEKKVIDSIEDLSSKKTVIMIAHRLSTVKNCDRIYVMKNGEIVDWGSYEEIALKGVHIKLDKKL
jgi:ATP-binding cassette subfamily B protein